jgi:hypothetical protein
MKIIFGRIKEKNIKNLLEYKYRKTQMEIK